MFWSHFYGRIIPISCNTLFSYSRYWKNRIYTYHILSFVENEVIVSEIKDAQHSSKWLSSHFYGRIIPISLLTFCSHSRNKKYRLYTTYTPSFVKTDVLVSEIKGAQHSSNKLFSTGYLEWKKLFWIHKIAKLLFMKTKKNVFLKIFWYWTPLT